MNGSNIKTKTELFLRKLYYVLKKNYYIATRNPKLYAALIIGPLLFVLIIGMAFNSSQLRTELKVSLYDESPNQEIYRTFDRIRNIDATNATSEEECKYTTINKQNVVCVAIIHNETTQGYDVNMYFDYSRMSIYTTAYTTIREIMNAIEQRITINILNELRQQTNPENFGFENMKLELDLTEKELAEASKKINELIKGISSESDFYKYKLDEVITEITNIKNQVIIHQKLVDEYKKEIRTQRQEAENIYNSLNAVLTSVNALSAGCGTEGTDRSGQIHSAYIVDLINSDTNPGCTAAKTMQGLFKGYEQSYSNVKNGLITAEKELDNIYSSLDLLQNAADLYIEVLREEQNNLEETGDTYSAEITEFKDNIDEYSGKVKEYGDIMQKLNEDMNQFHLALNPAAILNQFEQNVKELSNPKSQLDYSLHLVIPFILLLSTLLISITLNRNEYKTTAHQRNRMMKNNFMIFTGNSIFIVILMLLELLFILILFKLFFGANTLQNLFYVILIAIIFILIWSIIGFIISRKINSDEGAIFSGTILGLIVFFLSDVMVPVETFPNLILYLYNLNPFVHFADIIRTNYLIGETTSILSTSTIFLITALIILTIISSIMVWRDMNGK